MMPAVSQSSTTAPPLTTSLRGCIAAEHEAIEQTPFSIQLMTGTLSRDSYALNLAQMFHIHNSIESLAASTQRLRPFFMNEMRRADMALQDLTVLGYELGQFPLLPETARCVEHIDAAAQDCPETLIGGIYVLEGSRMGSLVLAKPLARCLQISGAPNSGIDYHIAGAADVRGRLKAWKEVVDTTPFDAATTLKIVAFARQFMVDLLEMYRAIPVTVAPIAAPVAVGPVAIEHREVA